MHIDVRRLSTRALASESAYATRYMTTFESLLHTASNGTGTLGRAARGALAVGPREVAPDVVSSLRFQFGSKERRAAEHRLTTCHEPSDYLKFAEAYLPGNRYHVSGASQKTGEFLSFLEFAARRNPRVVLEIGTQAGGTNFLLGQAIASVQLVIGIDLYARNRLRLESFRRAGLDVHLIDGRSASSNVHEQVRKLLGQRTIDLLFVDGDHSFTGAAEDFRRYRPLVTPKGLIAFHDIVPDNQLCNGIASGAWAGEVPILWEILRTQYVHHEFVDSWNQEGSGIGVLDHDPKIKPRLAPRRGMSAEAASAEAT